MREEIESIKYNIRSKDDFDLEKELWDFNNYLGRAGYEQISWNHNKNVRKCVLEKLTFVLDDIEETVKDLNSVNDIENRFNNDNIIQIFKKGIRIISYQK